MDRSRGLASRLLQPLRLAVAAFSPQADPYGGRGLEQRACGSHGQLYLRTRFRQEGETGFRTRFPAEPTETLAHGFFAKAKSAGNPTIAHLLGFEAENGAVSPRKFLVHGRTGCGPSLGARVRSIHGLKRS